MTGTEIYKRTPAYDRDAKAIRLHAPQWKLLLAYDGQRTLAEVALSAEMALAEALPLTEKFLDRGWIAEEPITLDQYLKRSGAQDLSTLGAAVPPVVILHEPEPEKPATPVTPPPTSSSVPPPPPFTPLSVTPPPSPKIAPATPPARGPMRLGAVVHFIVSTVGNNSLGQLLAYRVFLRVPTSLLLAEDILTVNLVNEPAVVRGEQLQQAIADAVAKIVKRPLPDNVFAAA